MTINELISKLEELREQFGGEETGGEIEVRLMSQPNWPFEWTIDGVTCNHFFCEEDVEDEELDEPIAYICEGRQLGYGARSAWDNMI